MSLEDSANLQDGWMTARMGIWRKAKGLKLFMQLNNEDLNDLSPLLIHWNAIIYLDILKITEMENFFFTLMQVMD